MNETIWFKDWFNSHYYHLLYQNRGHDEASDFIERLIAYLNPPKQATMLDVACGKGRHSKALAEMGFDVTGIDLSEASIAEAKKEENGNLHFYQHDMRLPFRTNYYNYAFNFFTSFGYFKTQREHNKAIRTIARSLKKEGLFVIDYLNVGYVSEKLQKAHTLNVDNITFNIKKWQDEQHFFKQIQIIDGDNTDPSNVYTEKVAKFSLSDFHDMFKQEALQIEEAWGDYALGEYDEKESPRMIIAARKLG